MHIEGRFVAGATALRGGCARVGTSANRAPFGLREHGKYRGTAMRKMLIAVAGAALLGLAGCGHSTGERALSGGAIGAGGGALAGSALGAPATGAIVGGLGGAAVGAGTADRR
jgi:osmotically inducible lipoprotein OsmB